MSQASRALKAYRNALRATSVAFKNDLPTLNAARNEIRTHMKSLEDPKGTNRSIDERLKLLEEVTVFLRRNIVQGRKVDEDKYRLNIHKDTELGDNDDIKKKRIAHQVEDSLGVVEAAELKQVELKEFSKVESWIVQVLGMDRIV